MILGLGLGINLNQIKSGAFSPLSLFSASEQGVFYDCSDLTTLFADPAGTTPVTAPGNTVGLMLDKSRGGRQTLPTTGWAKTSGDGTVTVDGNTITITGATTTTRVDIAAPGFVVGDYADITVTGSTAGATGATLFLGGSAAYSTLSGTNTFRNVISASTLLRVQISTGSATFVIPSRGYVPGNHATQGITAARPTYSIEPVGGRRNLLTFSEDFSNVYWGKGNLTATATSINETATNTTHQLTPSSGTNTANVPNTLSFEVKPNGRSHINVAWANSGSHFAAFSLSGSGSVLSNQTAGIGTIALLPDGYYRITYTNTPTFVGATFYSINPADGAYPTTPVPSYLGDVTKGVLLRNAQLETGSTATAYQRVTTQHDVTEAGVASVGYLYFDGASDNMVTSTITPGTDKAQVFAGVRKLSDTAGVVAEFSASIGNPGTFGVYSGSLSGASTSYGFYLNGTSPTGQLATPFSSPVTSVLSLVYDIAQTTRDLEVKPRVNGVVPTLAGQIDPSAGTGNFLAYPLYLGGRGGTSLFYSGHLYSLITRFGPTLDAPTISSTEIWVGDKTGIVI